MLRAQRSRGLIVRFSFETAEPDVRRFDLRTERHVSRGRDAPASAVGHHGQGYGFDGRDQLHRDLERSRVDTAADHDHNVG
jgi:hypothetical protein